MVCTHVSDQHAAMLLGRGLRPCCFLLDAIAPGPWPPSRTAACGPLRNWRAWAAGQEGTIAAPAEAAQSTKNTSDLLRRWKEYATSFKVTGRYGLRHGVVN